MFLKYQKLFETREKYHYFKVENTIHSGQNVRVSYILLLHYMYRFIMYIFYMDMYTCIYYIVIKLRN